MQQNADAVYSRRPWDALPSTVQSSNVPASGPNPPNDERITSERLMSQLLNVPAPLERNLFPNRFLGYERTALTIEDILNVDAVYPYAPSMSDFSGTPAGMTGGTVASPSYTNTLGNA